MHKKWISSAIVFTLLAAQLTNVSASGLLKDSGKSPDSQQNSTEQEKRELLSEAEGYQDRFIVRFSGADTDTSEMQTYAQAAFEQASEQKALQADAVSAGMESDGERQELARILDLGVSAASERAIKEAEIEKASGEYEVVKLPEKVSPDVFIEEILQEAGEEIAYIQPDYIVNLASEAVEGELTEETAEQLSAMPQGSILDREADLQEAWKCSDGTGITIALLDTGVDTFHPDLDGHVLTGYDFINDREGVYDAELGMEQVHGTHMAGIIAQSAPGAQILPLKVFEQGNAYTSDILEAIAAAEEQGASIVNMSFGCTEDNRALREAMEMSELFFVCAAGNHRKDLGETPIYPASFGLKNSISVAALNQDLGIAYFSNYGEEADIAAWGRDVCSIFPGGERGEMDGTSMAAGYVSAAAAMAAASGVEADRLKARLKDTADKVSCLEGKISGGNKLSFSGAVYGTVKEGVTEVVPKEDLDEAYELMTPTEKMELFNAKKNIAIAAGGSQALALKEDGTVWAWGYMGTGGPALGTEDCSYEPLKVVGLEDIVAISAGFEHCLALNKDGKVYAWGANSEGQLGDGTTTGSRIPVCTPNMYSFDKVKGISAGQNHSLAVTEIGTILGWGANEYGQVGNASRRRQTIPSTVAYYNDMVKVSAGCEESMALDSNGNVFVWGKNAPQELNSGISYIIPMQVDFEQKVKNFSTGFGSNRAFITEENGTIWGWGRGYMGDGSTDSSGVEGLHQIVGSKDTDLKGITELAVGRYNTLALRQDGSVWGWGENRVGELGKGSKGAVSVATMLHYNIKAVAVGDYFSLMLTKDGTILASGSNGNGQCGQPESVSGCLYPVVVAVGENISFNTAEPMGLDEDMNGALVSGRKKRYYSFVPSKTGIYSFESISDYDLYGTLYNSEREQIAYNENGNCAGESTKREDFYMEEKLTEGQTYYLLVSTNESNQSGQFRVKVKYKDDYVNDTAGAEEIKAGEDRTCNIDYAGDIDMFRFVPTRTAIYTFEAVSDFDTYGKLYNASGTEIAYNDDGKLQGESTNRQDFYIKYPLEASQTYYISVKAYSPSKTGSLVLKVKESQDDYAGQMTSAFDISGQNKVEGEINYIGDTDAFVYIPKTDGTYMISTAGSTSLGGTLLIINSDSNIRSQAPVNVGNNIKFEVQLNAGETCYLLLHNRDTSVSSVGSYQVHVEAP